MEKDCNRAVTPAAEAVHIPAQLVLPGSLQAKQLCHLQTQLSLGQSCHGQKMSCVYACRVTLVASGSLQPCRLWPARLLLGWGVPQARTLGRIGQYWLPYSYRALYFLLSQLPTPLSTWCCQNPCDPSSCTTPHLALTGAKPSSPGQPQEQTPVDDPYPEVEIKPQLKSRGSVAKEEDPKPSHQLYKLQIKSTRSTRQTLCLWNI